MADLPTSRPLNEKERELLDFMLTADFPGREELKTQADCAEVCWECDCGCGTVNFDLKKPCIRTVAHEPIPVEAYREFLDVLLFVKGGFLTSLEVVDYLDVRPLRYPSPGDLKLWVPPAQPAGASKPRKDAT